MLDARFKEILAKLVSSLIKRKYLVEVFRGKLTTVVGVLLRREHVVDESGEFCRGVVRGRAVLSITAHIDIEYPGVSKEALLADDSPEQALRLDIGIFVTCHLMHV